MIRRQAFQFVLRPTADQARAMRRFAGCCRFVYNRALALQQERHERGDKKLGYAALCKQLTAWRNDANTPWLKAAPVHPLQQTLKDLERGYTNFFAGRAKHPRFKEKGRSERFRYPDPKQINLDSAHNRMYLPKLGWLRYRNSRPVLGTVKNVTVCERAGRWFVSIQTERVVEPKRHASTSCVGIDMGVTRFATLSDGTSVRPRNSFKQHETALRTAQQSLSRKVRFSHNWHKAKTRVARIQSRIANVRRDFLHQTSTTISQNHAMIVIEDLKVRNMTASATGTVENPGTNVRAKAGLNRAILDQGWAEFRRQLDYKLDWAGGQLMAVDPRNTSRTCPACGHVAAANRRSQAVFACVDCGHAAHADHVGAINILRAGHALLACEVSDTESPAAGTHRSDSEGALCHA